MGNWGRKKNESGGVEAWRALSSLHWRTQVVLRANRKNWRGPEIAEYVSTHSAFDFQNSEANEGEHLR